MAFPRESNHLGEHVRPVRRPLPVRPEEEGKNGEENRQQDVVAAITSVSSKRFVGTRLSASRDPEADKHDRTQHRRNQEQVAHRSVTEVVGTNEENVGSEEPVDGQHCQHRSDVQSLSCGRDARRADHIQGDLRADIA